MGFAETTMNKIMGAKQQTLQIDLQDNGKDARIIFRASTDLEQALNKVEEIQQVVAPPT